jgi:hypothetical protein
MAAAPPAGAGGGGGAFSDVPCQSQNGCLVGDAELTLHCAAPDDGSGVTTWDAVVSAHAGGTGQDGGCGVAADGQFWLAFGNVNESYVSLWLPSFTGGGPYHLGGETALGQSDELSVAAQGYRGDPSGLTHVGTKDTCSQGCELAVLPGDQPLGSIGEWVTYRFVVTCNNPLGTGVVPCGQCTMSPATFTVDAACYFPPPAY